MFHRHHSTTVRRRLTRGAALGVVLTGLLATSVSAATTNVDVNDGRFFSPSRVTQTPGGSVHWLASGFDDHSVTSDQGLFDTGAPRAGVDFTRTFSAGTFAYHCRKHGINGGSMVGAVTVAPQVTAAPTGLPFTVKWATAASNTGTGYDVQYRIGSGTWQNWKSNTGAASAVFGARSNPVRVAAGKTYSFRVVSRTGTAKSGLSPVKSFRAS
jgi:plastocyanin